MSVAAPVREKICCRECYGVLFSATQDGCWRYVSNKRELRISKETPVVLQVDCHRGHTNRLRIDGEMVTVL